jgi:hypothetical protein
MKRTFPKYLVAEADSDTWIIRTRNPFVMARCEPRGVVGLRLFCWPPSARQTPGLDSIISTMAQIWAEDVDGLSGLPSKWDFIFDDKTAPPEYLMADSYRSSWSCILRTKNPRCLIPLDDELLADTDGFLWLDPPRASKPSIVRDALRFLTIYKEREAS